METLTIDKKTKNNVIKEYSYYNSFTNTSFFYKGDIAIAKLDHTTDYLESYEDMSEEEKDFYYEEMQKNKEEEISNNYDVRAEQGLYGYGY